MEKTAFDEYLKKLTERENNLKTLKEIIKIYDRTIKDTEKAYSKIFQSLHQTAFAELKEKYGEDFEINLTRLKKHLVGEDGKIVFGIMTRISSNLNNSNPYESLKDQPFLISFLSSTPRLSNPSFLTTFNPDKKLINNAPISSLVVFRRNEKIGGFTPEIFSSSADLITINLKEAEAFAKQEAGYGSYKNVKAIMCAVQEQKQIFDKTIKQNNEMSK